MSDFVYNISKGAVAEKVRDSDSVLGMMLLQAAEADATLKDRTDIADLLTEAGNTEATFTNYARKTALTGVITVDNTNDRVDVDIPDQTWTAAGGGLDNTLTDLVVFYEDAAADATRVPLTNHDFATTTDGADLIAQVNAAGFFRAAE